MGIFPKNACAADKDLFLQHLDFLNRKYNTHLSIRDYVGCQTQGIMPIGAFYYNVLN
jgi:hypothetical protein